MNYLSLKETNNKNVFKYGGDIDRIINEEWFYFMIEETIPLYKMIGYKKSLFWTNLSSSKYLRWYIVEKYPDVPWDYTEMSSNKNITIEDVINNPDKPWDYTNVSEYIKVTYEIVRDNPQIPWDYETLVKNDGIMCDDIYKLNIPSDIWIKKISSNNNLTIKFLRENLDKPFDWYDVSLSDFTWNDIIENIDLPWCWNVISDYPDITKEIVDKHPEIEWDNASLVMKFDPELVIKDLPDNLVEFLSLNYKLTTTFIKEHPDIKWDWSLLCKFNTSFKFDVDFLQEYEEELECYIEDILIHPSVTWEMINEVDYLKSNMEDIVYMNPNVSIDNALEYKYIDMGLLSKYSSQNKRMIELTKLKLLHIIFNKVK
jgi:hypothetical protein